MERETGDAPCHHAHEGVDVQNGCCLARHRSGCGVRRKDDPGFVVTRCEITGTEIGTQLTKFEALLEVQFRSLQKDLEERLGKNAAAFLDAAQGRRPRRQSASG